MNNKYLKESLKLEYVLVFNSGLVIFTFIGCVYDCIYRNFLGFLYYNVLNLNFEFIALFAVASFCGSLANYFHFTIIREEGPLTLAIVSSFRKVLSIMTSIIVYNKTIDAYKWLAIIIISSLIFYEIGSKSKKNKTVKDGEDCEIKDN